LNLLSNGSALAARSLFATIPNSAKARRPADFVFPELALHQRYGKALQFVSQPYTSDIDHTGSLSEAIVTLPETIPPKASIELEIAYEGVIMLDATRLTRIGAPEDEANSSDWDQISPQFTAVRGFGNVAWYPVATEAASLSEGKSLFEVEGRWREREIASTMHLQLAVPNDQGNTQEQAPELLVNATSCR